MKIGKVFNLKSEDMFAVLRKSIVTELTKKPKKEGFRGTMPKPFLSI